MIRVTELDFVPSLFFHSQMGRRSIPAKIIDERTFAVRLRFSIPEGGFWRIDDLHKWLRVRTNRQFAIHSASMTGIQSCAYLHLNDLAAAVECVEKFDLPIYGLPKETP